MARARRAQERLRTMLRKEDAMEKLLTTHRGSSEAKKWSRYVHGGQKRTRVDERNGRWLKDEVVYN